MALFLCALLGATLSWDPPACCGLLYQPAFCLDDEFREPAHPYYPQPGDLFLATDHGWELILAHKLALIGSPHHSGIVIARPDGRLALLEAAPFDTLHVAITDCLPQMKEYCHLDKVWIRRRGGCRGREPGRRKDGKFHPAQLQKLQLCRPREGCASTSPRRPSRSSNPQSAAATGGKSASR
jgi:hypothetical protein